MFTTRAVQRPLWFLEGNDCESRTAYWQLLLPLKRCRPVQAVVTPARRHPIGALAAQLTRRVEPGKSSNPYRFVWKKVPNKTVFSDTQRKVDADERHGYTCLTTVG